MLIRVHVLKTMHKQTNMYCVITLRLLTVSSILFLINTPDLSINFNTCIVRYAYIKGSVHNNISVTFNIDVSSLNLLN